MEGGASKACQPGEMRSKVVELEGESPTAGQVLLEQAQLRVSKSDHGTLF